MVPQAVAESASSLVREWLAEDEAHLSLNLPRAWCPSPSIPALISVQSAGTAPCATGSASSGQSLNSTVYGDTFLLGYPPARFQIVATRSSIDALRIGGANMD